MKFHDIPYQRINLDVMKKQADAITADLKNSKNYEEAKQAFLHWQEFSGRVRTASSIANTRNNINTADEFYAQEKAFYNEKSPVIQEYEQAFLQVVYDSRFKKELEKDWAPYFLKISKLHCVRFHLKLSLFCSRKMN